jgi:AraC-like DNA-binding protein
LLLLNFFLIIFLLNTLYLFLSDTTGFKLLSSLSLCSFAIIGPLTFFYVKAFCDKAYKFNYQDVVHFLPGFLPLIFNVGFCKLHIGYIAGYVFLYLILSVFWVGRREISGRKKLWIYSLLGGLTGIALLTSFFSFGTLCIISISIGFTVITYFVSYLGIKFYSDLFTFYEPKNTKPKIVDLDAAVLFERITNEVKSGKLYKDPDLTMPRLSEMLGIHTHKLSFIINSQSGATFTEFINALRIEESKALLLQGKMKVAALAYECGFNSLSSFYAIFKKQMGVSPSEYRKQHQPKHR